jgi:hypothetical protein
MAPAVEIPGAEHDTHAVAAIPGAREPGMLTTFRALAPSVVIPDGPSTMDAATTAERRREGGGAPGQRRPDRDRSASQGLEQWLQQFATAARAVRTWRFRTNHV